MVEGHQWTLKFSTAQPRVPAGQSGGGRWTSGGRARSGRSPTTTATERQTFSTGHFDEQAESGALMVVQGQSSTPKEGVTRVQLERFYARRNAAQTAARTRYRNSKQSIAQHIDKAVSDGYTKYSATNRWTTLTRPSDGDAFRYSGKVERDYINVALDRGSLKRNY